MLVGTDDCVHVVFVCEETRVPDGNPPVRLNQPIVSQSYCVVNICLVNCFSVFVQHYISLK